MAETWSKKEREKKKRAIKKEKAEKRAMRGDSTSTVSGNNLDSMIAYLDEDGNLTSTPPDPRKKLVKKSDGIENLPVG